MPRSLRCMATAECQQLERGGGGSPEFRGQLGCSADRWMSNIPARTQINKPSHILAMAPEHAVQDRQTRV